MAEKLFSKDHIWVQQEENQLVRTGITDFAQQELGEIVFIELPEAGKACNSGDVLCSLDSLKSSSEIYAPVSGEIVAVNDKLSSEDTLGIINSAPMAEGWLFTIRMKDPQELSALMNENEYRDFIEE